METHSVIPGQSLDDEEREESVHLEGRVAQFDDLEMEEGTLGIEGDAINGKKLGRVNIDLLEASMTPPRCTETTLKEFLAYLDEIIEKISECDTSDGGIAEIDSYEGAEGNADICLEKDRQPEQAECDSAGMKLSAFISQLAPQLSAENYLVDDRVTASWNFLQQQTLAEVDVKGKAYKVHRQ